MNKPNNTKKSAKKIEKNLSGEVSGILREIDEELKIEKLKTWMKKYGAKIAIVFSIIVIITASLWLYQARNIENRQNIGTKFSQAIENIDTENENIGSLLELQKFIENVSQDDIYKALAQMKLADAYLKQQQNQDAVALYEKIASDEQINDNIRSFAKINLVAINIDELTYETTKQYLQEIANDNNNPWRFLSCELLALSAYKEARYKEAEVWLEFIFNHQAQVSISLLTRANVIKSVLAGYDDN